MMSLLLACVLLQSPAPVMQWGGSDSGVARMRFELVSDAKALEDVWRLTHDGSTQNMPQIDFTRSRLVLACRGREVGVPRVTATGLDRTETEVILSIEAPPTSRGKETTAWGMFLVPKTPEPVRLRRKRFGRSWEVNRVGRRSSSLVRGVPPGGMGDRAKMRDVHPNTVPSSMNTSSDFVGPGP